MYKGKYLSKAVFSLLMVLATMIGNKATAQLSGLQSIYFMNQYLTNPAMAGLEKGLTLNMGYQQQWTTIPGAPKLQSFTADYNNGNRVGLGLNVNSDEAGLISRTRVMGTYAYHLQLNEANDQKLNFGLSLGINDTYIDYNKVAGDQGDASVQNYNQRNVYIDGDFGASYTSNKLTIQGALPNLKSLFGSTDGNNNLTVDRSTFFTALSYKMDVDNGISKFTLEPKLAYRGVKGFDNIFDVGANFDMTDYHFNLSALYHTNQSVTVATGFDLGQTGLFFSYSNNTGPLSTYAQNTFEFGMKLKIWDKK